MNSNFYSTLAKGNKSEVLVSTYLANRGWIIEDKTKEKEYQSLEIDIIATRADVSRSIEIKQDNRVGNTGNLLLETITNKKCGSIGWFNKTQADIVIYHDTINKQLITVYVDELRQYLQMAGNQARYREWKCDEGYTIKTACGYTIPINDYELYFHVGIDDLEEEIAC